MTGAGQGGLRSALAGVRVLDLSSGVAGQFCGRLFADNGAEVVLVEPSGGSGLRASPPLVDRASRPAESALFWHLNLGKTSRQADPNDPADRAAVVRLAASCDAVVLDGIWQERVSDLLSGPRVLCRITPFGDDTELGSAGGGEMVFQAQSGVMFESGEPGRPPLFGVGHRASYAAGAIGYVQALAVLVGTPAQPGAGARVVDVAIAEVAASMSFCRITQYSYNGEIEGRDARTIPRAIVPCADGWVSLFIYDHRWLDSCRAMGLDDLAVDARFQDEASRLRHWDEFTVELSRRFAGQSCDELVTRGQAGKAVVARAMLPTDLWHDPQLAARDFWRWLDPASGRLPRLGPMFGFSGTPQVDRGGAPALGPRLAHRPVAASTVPGPVLSGRPSWRRTRRPVPDARPFGALRVLDLTTAWAGPMATRLLAALGAEIVKVEGPGRIDDWRGPVGGGLGSRYPDQKPGERPYDRCYQFNTQNHDKLGVAIDLKTPDGLRLARQLAGDADVLIANFSAGTLERMGLGWAALRESNPRLVLVEMPAYGDRGPYGAHVALGPSMELMSGMATLIGYGDGRPVTTGPAYVDPIGGFNAAAAVVTALAARELTGAGQHVELAQRDAAMHWIGEEIVWSVATGMNRLPDGNRSRAAVPHNAFRAAGADQWLVVAAYTDAQFAALTQVPGLEELAGTAAYRSLDGRLLGQDDIEGTIAAWTAPRDKHAAAHELRAAGVPAAAVADAGDLAASAFLRARGLVQRVDHPAAGSHEQQGVPLHISGLDLGIRQPAPCFGQDTRKVLAGLGYRPEQVEQWFEDGVVAEAPRAQVAVVAQ